MSQHMGDDKPIEHLLGNLLLPGDDGDITDSSVEEFLRLYDELCPSLSSSDLEQVKERTREAARDTETRQIAAQALETQAAAAAAAAIAAAGGAAGAGGREMAPPVAAAGSGGAGGGGGGKEVVQVREMSFYPAELDVASGQEVQWVAAQGSNIKHSLEVYSNWSEEVVAESPPLVPGKPFSWAFPDKGEYTVSSCVYSFMQAKVYVDFPAEEDTAEEEGEEVPGAQGRRSSSTAAQHSPLSAAASASAPPAAAAPAVAASVAHGQKKTEKGGTGSPGPPGLEEVGGAPAEPSSPPPPHLSGHLKDSPCSVASSSTAHGGSQGSSNSSIRKKGHRSSAAVVEETGAGAGARAGAGPSSPLRTPATASAAASPRGLPIAMMMERPQGPRVPAPQLREPEGAASKSPSKQSPHRATGEAAAKAGESHRYRGYEAEAEEEHHRQEASEAQQGSAAADKAADKAACSPAGVDAQPKAKIPHLQLPVEEQARVPRLDLQQQQQQHPAQDPEEEGPSHTASPGEAEAAPVAAADPSQSNAAAPHEARATPIAATAGSSGSKRAAPPSWRLHRCRLCHSAFISYINLQRCNARHHANKTLRRQHKQGPAGSPQRRGLRGSKGPSSLTLPTRDEFLDFWGKLPPEEAEALLCLRNPGETGEILLQEAAAAGLGTAPPPGIEGSCYGAEDEDAAGTAASTPRSSTSGGGPITPRSQANKAAYRAAASRLFRVVGGTAGDSAAAAGGAQPQLVPGEELLRLLHACSEGTVLYKGARARGSLADMMLPANLGASLALLVEGQVVEAWRVQQEAAMGREEQAEEAPAAPVPPKHQNQQNQQQNQQNQQQQNQKQPPEEESAQQQGPDEQSLSSGRRTKPRKPRKKKNRRPGVAEQPGGGTATEGDTTTTLDEATTTDADVGEPCCLEGDADVVLQGLPDSPGSANGSSTPLLPLPEVDEAPPEMLVLTPVAEAHDLPDMDNIDGMEGGFFFEGPPQQQQQQQQGEEDGEEERGEEDAPSAIPPSAAAATTEQEGGQEPLSPHQEQPPHPPGAAIRFGTVEMDELIQFGTVDIGELLGGTLDADKVQQQQQQQQPGLYVLNGASLHAEGAALPSTVPVGFVPGVPGGAGHPNPLHGSTGGIVMIGGPPPALAQFLPPPGPFVHAPQVVQPYGVPQQPPQQQHEVAMGVPMALGMPQEMPVHHPGAPMAIPIEGRMPHQGEVGAVYQRSPEGGSPPSSHHPSAEEGEEGAQEQQRERELSLKQANQYFAGLLQQMQQAPPSGGSPGDTGQCGEAAAEGAAAEREEGESEGEALQQQQQDAAPPSSEQNGHGDEGFSAADEADGALEGDEEIAKETLRLQDPLVFDPDLARRLLRQQWLLAVADVRSGIGRRHVNASSAAATPAVPACKTESALPVQ